MPLAESRQACANCA